MKKLKYAELRREPKVLGRKTIFTALWLAGYISGTVLSYMFPRMVNSKNTAIWDEREGRVLNAPYPFPVSSSILLLTYLPSPLGTCKRRRPHGRCRWSLEYRRRRHNHQCSHCSHLHSSRWHTHSHSLHYGWHRCPHSDRHWAAAGIHPHPLCRTVLLGENHFWLELLSLKGLVPYQPPHTLHLHVTCLKLRQADLTEGQVFTWILRPTWAIQMTFIPGKSFQDE